MIVGRSTERGRLRRCLEDARNGSGSSIVLCAEAGLGKSALLDELVHLADDVDATVVRIEGVRGEEQLAWAGLGQLVAPLRWHLVDLAGQHSDALARATGSAPGSIPAPHAVYVATLALVAEAATTSAPLLVVVDDLHWLDRETAGALVFLARRLAAVPASLVIATRDLVDLDLPNVVTLTPLDDESCAQIVSAARPVAPTPLVSSRLLNAAQGNPLALLALVAALSDDQLSGAEPLPDPLPLDPGLDVMLSTRLEALPGETREALACLAMSRSAALTVDDVLDVAEVGIDALEPAESAGIVAIASGRVRFTHPLHRSAAYWSHDPARVRVLHSRFAARETDPVRAVLHADDATTRADTGLGERLVVLAADARAHGNHTTALSLSMRAERHVADGAMCHRLSIDIALDAIALGNIGVARARAAALDERVAPREVYGIRAAIADHDGAMQEAVQLWRLAVAASSDADAAADIAIAGAVALIRRVDLPAVASLLHELDIDARAVDDRRATALDVLRGIAQLATSRVDAEAIARMSRYTELIVDDDAIAAGLDLVAEVVCPALAMFRIYDAALDLAARVEAIAIDRQNPRVMPAVEVTRGMVAFRRNFAAAASHFEEAVSLADALGHPTLATSARSHLSVILGQLGRPETVPMAAALMDSPLPNDRIAGRMGLGIYWLTLGVPERTLDALLPIHLDPDIDPTQFVLRWQADLGEAAARCGETRLAHEVADQLASLASGGESWLIGAHHRVRGMLATVDECGDHFGASVEAMRSAVNTSAEARAELLWGERLRRARRRAEARPHLERARDLFRDLACGRWVERAELELVAAGAAAGTSDHTRDPDRVLTPHELHVARLAVAGSSYKDIAAQLFVSPRTVESHLSSIYRKLGVKNRAGLAVLAANEPALQPVS